MIVVAAVPPAALPAMYSAAMAPKVLFWAMEAVIFSLRRSSEGSIPDARSFLAWSRRCLA